MHPLEDRKRQILAQIQDLEFEGKIVFFSELAKHDDQIDKKTKEHIDQVRKKLDLETPFHAAYQSWYSRTLPVVKQMAPDRYAEFVSLYITDRKGKPIDYLSYTISDYLLGVNVRQYGEPVIDPLSVLSSKFQQQLHIFSSLKTRAESAISDIYGIIQADLFDTELQAAEQMLSRKHARAAGALGGVTLERHLASVCRSRDIKFRKKSIGIADYNNALKDGGAIDLATWRYIQFLADVRNSCVHMRGEEPEHDQVKRMIDGVKEIIKQVF